MFWLKIKSSRCEPDFKFISWLSKFLMDCLVCWGTSKANLALMKNHTTYKVSGCSHELLAMAKYEHHAQIGPTYIGQPPFWCDQVCWDATVFWWGVCGNIPPKELEVQRNEPKPSKNTIIGLDGKWLAHRLNWNKAKRDRLWQQSKEEKRKLDHGTRQASVEMLLEELQELPPLVFQSAKEMNVKRLAEEWQYTA